MKIKKKKIKLEQTDLNKIKKSCITHQFKGIKNYIENVRNIKQEY